MEKLRNLLLYGGAMPDVYRNCRDEIRKENLEKLFFFLSVEIVFLLIALAVLRRQIAGRRLHRLHHCAGWCAGAVVHGAEMPEQQHRPFHLCRQFSGHLLSAEPLSGLLCLPE